MRVHPGILKYGMWLTLRDRPLENLIKSYADKTFFLMNTWDYLINNQDRHANNWGVLYNSDTTQILGCHPLIDHGASFGREPGFAPVESKVLCGMDSFEVAKRSNSKYPLEFTEPLTEADFLKPQYYKAFMERLGRLYYGDAWQDLFK